MRKIHPREITKKARIARAKQFKALLPTMTMYDIGQAQTPPISTQRVSYLIRSLGK